MNIVIVALLAAAFALDLFRQRTMTGLLRDHLGRDPEPVVMDVAWPKVVGILAMHVAPQIAVLAAVFLMGMTW